MNKKIEELYNKIDGLNTIIDQQALEISQLKEQKKQAIEYIKKHIIEDSEYENYMQCEREEKEELLEILGDKE